MRGPVLRVSGISPHLSTRPGTLIATILLLVPVILNPYEPVICRSRYPFY